MIEDGVYSSLRNISELAYAGISPRSIFRFVEFCTEIFLILCALNKDL